MPPSRAGGRSRPEVDRPGRRILSRLYWLKGRIPVCGGTIGFVGPLAELFGGAPALLLGIEGSRSSPNAPNESLHEADWKSLMRSLVHLFANLAALPGGKVKA